MLDLSTAFEYLVDSGFVDYVVSFILVFTVSFYTLKIIPIFRKNKNANTLISFALGLIFISNQTYVQVIKNIIYDYSVILVIMILIAMVTAFILYVSANYTNDDTNKGKST